MDLRSTLIRAEGLYRRFERTVEAVDRKDSFPAPKLPAGRPTKPTAGAEQKQQTQGAGAADALGKQSTGTPARARPSSSGVQGGAPQKEKEKVISPELRALLSRQPPKMDRKEVEDHGGGVHGS